MQSGNKLLINIQQSEVFIVAVLLVGIKSLTKFSRQYFLYVL